MITVRIPPSPTGFFHIGTARTALYNYLFAKKHGGKIVMRMEDTDTERNRVEYEENILNGIQKLGMSWDGEVEYQSKRTEIYTQYLAQLLQEGKAYHCFCTPEELTQMRETAQKEKKAFRYPGTWRNADPEQVAKKLANGDPSVIRFRIPENRGPITFTDHVRGEVSIHTKELDDFVIAKNPTTPLYNFCVVIDDHDMKISHVIRGEDHISNTPKQILIFEAFEWNIPEFAHLPLILNQDKSKLSKRKNKVSVDDYLADGFLPESIINFLALLGWNTSDEQEFFNTEDLIHHFSLDRVHKSGAVFDIKKLEHINGKYIRDFSTEEFAQTLQTFWKNTHSENPDSWFPKSWDIEKIKDPQYFLKALALVHERTKKLSEVQEFLHPLYISTQNLDYSPSLYTHKKMKTSPQTAPESLNFSLKILQEYKGEWTSEALKTLFMEKINQEGYKNGFILYPLRVALSGEEFSPGTLELLEIFGKPESIQRIQKGLEIVQK